MHSEEWIRRQRRIWPYKLFLKRLVGRELWLRRDVKVATVEAAFWTYIADRLGPGSVVYSLGVGDSIDFDLHLIEQHGLTVWAFDPTPYATEWVAGQTLPKAFKFRPWAAAAEDGVLRLYRRVNRRGKRAEVMWTADSSAGDESDYMDAPAYTVQTMMEKLNHERVDLLKMDVEGAEYLILEGLKSARVLPRQLLVEFHHRFPGIGKARTAACIAMLRKFGYRIFNVSMTGREVGFVLEDPGASG